MTEYKFNLNTDNLIRIRFDECIAGKEWNDSMYNRFQIHIIDFYKIESYIIASELGTKTEKPHYHFVGYCDTAAQNIRDRLKSHVFRQTTGTLASVSDNWKTSTKYKHLSDVFTMLDITYAHFHIYYICKDQNILVNTLYPFINLNGYSEILEKLPQTVQTIRSNVKTRDKKPNYLKLLLLKYKKTLYSQIHLYSHQEKQDKIADFVISEVSSWNQSEEEHLGQLFDNCVLKRFVQTIYNTFHLHGDVVINDNSYNRLLKENLFCV